MQSSKKQWLLLATSMLVAPALTVPAFAQTGTTQGGIQEIVVTAQRVSQSVMQVPLSIQALSTEQLDKQGIKELTALQFNTPGFLTQTNSGFTQIYLRGVGNAIYLGADPSVATFVDDVPRIYGSMTDNLVDLERIEVLKGAQGGLYGRNATGGVVNIITRNPSTDAFKGNVNISYGEKNTFRASGSVNVPVNDKVAFTLGGSRLTHDPYIRNTATANPYSAANFPTGAFLPNGPGGTYAANTPQQTANYFNNGVVLARIQDQDFYSVRAKILFQPNDNLKIILAGDYYDKNDNDGGGQYNLTPANTQAALQGFFTAFGVNAVLPAGFVKGNSGKFSTAQGYSNIFPVDEYGASATITWNGPGFDLTSISAYRHQKTYLESDVNSSNVETIPLNVKFHKFFVYQELRAISTFEGPLQLLGGVTYLDNSLSGGQRVSLVTRGFFTAGNGYVKDNVKNWSVYLQGTYDFTDALSLAVSGRYMRETNLADFERPIVSLARTVQSKFIPSATLTYKLDGGSAYARWARGFKTGGVNLATAAAYYPRPEDGSVFKPEVVDTYEIGYKQSLLGRTLQVTAAAFYNDYKNIQVDGRARPTFPALTTAVVNAQSARTYGVEGSLQWRATDALTLGTNAGYLNAKYKKFFLTGSIALEDFNRNGQQMEKAPEFQISFTADLDTPINDAYRLVGSVLVSHTSKVLFQGSPGVGVPAAIGPGYWLTNARLGVRTTDDKYGLFVIADNMFNQVYNSFGQASFTGLTYGYGNPRIIRGELQVKF